MCSYAVMHAFALQSTYRLLHILDCISGFQVLVLKGARSNLGRPNTSPEDNKLAFMEMLSK